MVIKGWSTKSLINYVGTTIQWIKLRAENRPSSADLRAFSDRWISLKRMAAKDEPEGAIIPTMEMYMKLSPKARGIFNFQTATGIRLQSLACLEREELIENRDDRRVYNLKHLKTLGAGYAGPRIASAFCNCSKHTLSSMLCPLHCEEPISLPVATRRYTTELQIAGFSSHSARRLMAVTFRMLVEHRIISWKDNAKTKEAIRTQFLWTAGKKDVFLHYSRDYDKYNPAKIPPFQESALRFFESQK